jgi:hypothetical protein
VRHVIFSMDELVGEIEGLVAPMIDFDPGILDCRHYVTAHLEMYFYGTPVPDAVDTGLHLPTDTVRHIRRIVEETAQKAIVDGFGVKPTHTYGFTVKGSDVMLTEFGPTETYVPGQEPSVQQCLDDGGWVPERLRPQGG